MSQRHPAVERWLTIIAFGLVVAVAKPWPGSETADPGVTGGPPDGPSGMSTIVSSPPTAWPTIDASPAGPPVSAFCLDPGVWLIASIELWRDQTIRVWRAFEPAAATGPDDPTIPVLVLSSEGLPELGWCAPQGDDHRPIPSARVDAWQRTATRSTPIRLVRSRPASADSPLGALYRAPAAPASVAIPFAEENAGTEPRWSAALGQVPPGSWVDGTYVFRYRGGDGSESWFAVQVELRASTGAP